MKLLNCWAILYYGVTFNMQIGYKCFNNIMLATWNDSLKASWPTANKFPHFYLGRVRRLSQITTVRCSVMWNSVNKLSQFNSPDLFYISSFIKSVCLLSQISKVAGLVLIEKKSWYEIMVPCPVRFCLLHENVWQNWSGPLSMPTCHEQHTRRHTGSSCKGYFYPGTWTCTTQCSGLHILFPSAQSGVWERAIFVHRN